MHAVAPSCKGPGGGRRWCYPWWTFQITFYFFLSGEGEGESEAKGRGGSFGKAQEGGFQDRMGSRGQEGVCGELGEGGGANFFISWPKCPPSIRHTIIARTFFCLENGLRSKARNAIHKITPALPITILQEFFCLYVIVLGNKAHETSASWNYTFWGMPNICGEII